MQYELAVLADAQHSTPHTRQLVAALRGQAERLWTLRVQRLAMLRQAQHREQLESERASAAEASLRDPLTGLPNRRAFDHQMDTVDHTRDQLHGPLVLLLVDVDEFKAVNDTFSHHAGDRVLQEVARAITTYCRTEDTAARFGGDEFAVFLRTDLARGTDIAERIRRAVATVPWHTIAPGIRVTLSIGAAALAPGMTARDLFDAADRQLYRAKDRGRNQVAASC